MMPAKRGLIVEVTENDIIGGGGNPIAHAVKMAQKVLPLLWAAELAPHGITVLAITPGFLRSETMLQHLGVTEDNWREAGKKDPNFLAVGVAVVRGTRDRRAGGGSEGAGPHRHAPQLVGAGARLRLHRLRWPRPDWGRHKIDFSVLPPAWIDLFRMGADLEIKWLTTLAARTRKFKAKIPR